MGEVHLARVEIEPRHLGEQDPHVLIGLEDRPQRIGHLARGQGPGGDLVAQGLEEVEVAPVDERDLHVGATQRLDRTQPAKASADDDDAVAHVWDAGAGTEAMSGSAAARRMGTPAAA